MKKNIFKSFKYAAEGIVATFRSERNMKIHCVMMCLVIIAGFVFRISIAEWVTCIILFAAVIAAELINTAIEAVIDMVMPEKNIYAKTAKDAAAGAVLVLAAASAVIGLIIFIPKFLSLIL